MVNPCKSNIHYLQTWPYIAWDWRHPQMVVVNQDVAEEGVDLSWAEVGDWGSVKQ